ncbi:syntaxin-binding protein 3 [Protopterus annectens]|uniref:syntaxin-binding protein 3 n=1 Tax=Protopterus annectens TaxID=7888 RepID=UPI001CF93492|nr:syntaxin-binding protein 3 [Protopterus annectens]
MAPSFSFGLKKKVWETIKRDVLDDCKLGGEWKILILDHFTTKLLSCCCKMSDLLAEGITTVEDIYKDRAPVNNLKAIYFITPEEKSVDGLISDFKKGCHKYKAAYLYFTDWNVTDIIGYKIPLKSVSAQEYAREIHSLFPVCFAFKVFTVDAPEAFHCLYSPHTTENKTARLETIAQQIVTLCATLDENPGVRFKKEPLDNATVLAKMVEDKLQQYYEIDERSKKKVRKIPKLIKELSASRKERDGNVTINALSSLMRKMPDFRKQMTKQTIHLHLAEDCMRVFQEHVEKLCKTEQDLALGTDAEGQKIKDPMRLLLPVLLNKKNPDYDKIRVILLYIFSLNGTTEENLAKLMQQVETGKEVVHNWKYLGVPVISNASSVQRKQSRDRSEETYQLSRWTPVIKDIIEDFRENKLDPKEWPHCSECSAAWNGSGATSARQNATIPRKDLKTGTRLIVFIIGGMTFSEMRCAYEVTQKHQPFEVIIGSTHIITPKKLMDDLKTLSETTPVQKAMETFEIIVEQ